MAIAGGGLGGLCLAQGLLRAGIDVTVYERDLSLLSRRQGYRLHVDARAGLALQECLPPDLFALFLATCGEGGRRFTVLSSRLRVLHEVRGDPEADLYAPASLSTSVNRQTLREVLSAGLEGRIVFGRELIRYESRSSGPRLIFGDGTHADADLLVGADGVNSAVRRRYLPHAQVSDTGVRCVYGRTPLGETTRKSLPPALGNGFTAVVGGRVGMACGVVRFRQRPEKAAASIAPWARLSPADDYLMWALTAQGREFGVSDSWFASADAAALHALAKRTVRGWHADLRRLVALAEADETFLVRIRTSSPVAAWEPSRVTLLGDAIHAMSPARGSGANTALRDAGVLCRALTQAVASGDSVTHAVGAYEAQMRDYGFAAVEASRQAEMETGARGSRLGLWLYKRLTRAKA
ncbi:MAG TPA: FAD-dependent monooxygenase [Actinocrinis sp.]|nr:FAD-dependent monooxygenase [Actinocrinis sp.]